MSYAGNRHTGRHGVRSHEQRLADDLKNVETGIRGYHNQKRDNPRLLEQSVRHLLEQLRPEEVYATLVVPSGEFPGPRLVVSAQGEVAVALFATLLAPDIPDPEEARAAAEFLMFGLPFPEAN